MSIASVSGKNARDLTPAEQKRIDSGKACAFEPNEVYYMLKIRELYSKSNLNERSVIFLPMDDESLSEMKSSPIVDEVTKNTVIEVWKKVNKARPDSFYQETNKKFDDLTRLHNLPLSKAKYDIIINFLSGIDRLAKQGGEVKIQSVSLNCVEQKMPKLVKREAQDFCKIVYPILDQLISCIPSEEISMTASNKGSTRGWELWTTVQECTDAALLKVKSRFVANLIVACLKSYNIIAFVTHSPPSTDIYVVMHITKSDSESLERFRDQLLKVQELLAIRFKETTQ